MYRNHTIEIYDNEKLGWVVNQTPCVGMKIGIDVFNKIFTKIGD